MHLLRCDDCSDYVNLDYLVEARRLDQDGVRFIVEGGTVHEWRGRDAELLLGRLDELADRAGEELGAGPATDLSGPAPEGLIMTHGLAGE